MHNYNAENQKDVFISHAGKDKATYISSIVDAMTKEGIDYWLDEIEISWGDSIAAKINKGLRESRYVLLCLSRSFLERKWPEDELYSMIAVQNQTGVKRVLPLILNSKDEILKAYPLLSDKAYREYTDPDTVARGLANLLRLDITRSSYITIAIESVHSEQVYKFRVSPRSSIAAITKMAIEAMHLKTKAEISSNAVIHVRWVLIDVNAEPTWFNMPRYQQHQTWAVVSSKDGIKVSNSPTDRIGELGVDSDTVFHISALENVERMQQQQQQEQQQQQQQ